MASRPAFFKFFFPHNSTNKLKIPSSFVHSIEGALPENLLLRDRYNNLWRVKVERNGDCFYFKDGWKNFVKDNLLKGGEAIVFEYFFKGRFDTKILGPCSCESKGVGGPKQRNTEEQTKLMETDIGETDDEGYDGDDDVSDDFLCKIRQENQPHDDRREQVPVGVEVPKAKRTEEPVRVIIEVTDEDETDNDEKTEDGFIRSADQFTPNLKKKQPKIKPALRIPEPPKPKNNGAVPAVPQGRQNSNLQTADAKAFKNAAPVSTVDRPLVDDKVAPMMGPDCAGGDASPLAPDMDAGISVPKAKRRKEPVRVIEMTDEDETDDDRFIFTTAQENHPDDGREQLLDESGRTSLKRKIREGQAKVIDFESEDEDESYDGEETDDDDGFVQNADQDQPVPNGETSRRRRQSYVNWRNSEWFGERIFRDGLAPRPVNPYFVAKRRTRAAELYIPAELMKLHNLDLPENLLLVDPRGGRFRARRKIWNDGRIFYSRGWRSLCRQNFVLKEDHCICEFVRGDGGDLVLHVSIVRANEQGVRDRPGR